MDANEARRFLSALKGMGIESYFVVKKDEITLPMLQKQVKACTRCPLARTRRTVVFGEGNEKAELVFVGEAPGEEEDLQGRPFVGRAGKLLDQMIQRMRLSRKDVFICNVLKCRPPQNRDPDASEIDMCKNYLFAQLEIIEPKVICALEGTRITRSWGGRAYHQDPRSDHGIQRDCVASHVSPVILAP